VRVFIGKSYNSIEIYTIEVTEITDYLDKIQTRKSANYLANLRIDHEIRENSVLKFIENSRIVGFGKGRDADFEIEIENGEKLEKLEHMLQVSLIYTEVKNVLKSYSEGKMTLDDTYVQLLPYVVAKSLVKS